MGPAGVGIQEVLEKVQTACLRSALLDRISYTPKRSQVSFTRQTDNERVGLAEAVGTGPRLEPQPGGVLRGCRHVNHAPESQVTLLGQRQGQSAKEGKTTISPSSRLLARGRV